MGILCTPLYFLLITCKLLDANTIYLVVVVVVVVVILWLPFANAGGEDNSGDEELFFGFALTLMKPCLSSASLLFMATAFLICKGEAKGEWDE